MDLSKHMPLRNETPTNIYGLNPNQVAFMVLIWGKGLEIWDMQTESRFYTKICMLFYWLWDFILLYYFNVSFWYHKCQIFIDRYIYTWMFIIVWARQSLDYYFSLSLLICFNTWSIKEHRLTVCSNTSLKTSLENSVKIKWHKNPLYFCCLGHFRCFCHWKIEYLLLKNSPYGSWQWTQPLAGSCVLFKKQAIFIGWEWAKQ